MASTPEFFRSSVKRFKAADALLSSQIKLYHDASSAKQAGVIETSAMAEKVAGGYLRAIERKASPPDDLVNVHVTTQVGRDTSTLKALSVEVTAQKNRLDHVNHQVAALKHQLEATLIHEQSALRDRRNLRIALAVVGICSLIALHLWLLDRTSLSFTLSLDGGSFPPQLVPVITLDGKPFDSRITPGRHEITVAFEGGETFTKTAWCFYGENDLGTLPLETSKGSLLVTVKPLPAKVILQRDNIVVHQGDAPLTADKLPVGYYTLLVQRGQYEERSIANIKRQQHTEEHIELNLGAAQVFSDPPDAEFVLSGNARNWGGKLPARIDGIPSGIYSLTVIRKGWEQTADVTVTRGNMTTNRFEFLYGSLEITSNPTGLSISTNGVEIGKTPLRLSELKPGQYSLNASDGENSLIADVTIAPREAAKHAFVFHYGTLQLSSNPTGATVTRKGKEIGKTPLTLNLISTSDSTLELHLPGYAPTNIVIRPIEGKPLIVSTRLFSERYLIAIGKAREAFRQSKFLESQNFAAAALEAEPNDPHANAQLAEAVRAAARVIDEQKEVARTSEIARRATEKSQIITTIEKAIAATGGRAAMNRFQSFKAVGTTTITRNGSDHKFQLTAYIQLPDRVRVDQVAANEPRKSTILGMEVTTTLNGGRPVASTYCVTESKTWSIVPGSFGMAIPIKPEIQKQYRRDLYLNHVASLSPLLGSEYTLSKKTEGFSAPPDSIALVARRNGKSDVTLFIDNTTSLLVGIDDDSVDENNNVIHHSARFSNFKTYFGAVKATETVYSRNGRRYAYETIESYEPLGSNISNMFEQPQRQ